MSAGDAGASVGVPGRVGGPVEAEASPALWWAAVAVALPLLFGLAAVVYDAGSHAYIHAIVLDLVQPVVRPWGIWSRDYDRSGVFIVYAFAFAVMAIPAVMVEVGRRAAGAPRTPGASLVRAAFWSIPVATIAVVYAREVAECLQPHRENTLLQCLLP